MTIRHLRIFLRVIDEGSVTKAAQSLYISQPSVSQVIAELETHYGRKLFDRIGKKMFLTQTGLFLEQYARNICAMFDEMERRVRHSDESGILRVGASFTVGSSVLPDMLGRLRKAMPQITPDVKVRNTKDIEEMLLRNTLDIAVVEGTIHTEDLKSVAMMRDEVILICGKTHPLYQTTSVKKERLNNQVFVLREPGSGTRELFVGLMTANGLNWKQQWESADSDGVVAAAKEGFGIGVISESLVKRELASGELHRIRVDGLSFVRTFHIVYHKNKYLSDAMKTLIETAQKYYGET
jgi:DNA-binding transcriptional LysR family regulator